MVDPTIAVLMALTSNVGEGAAPTLQAVRESAVAKRIIRMWRGNFLNDMWVPPIENNQNR
jgi:hypothetical protein